MAIGDTLNNLIDSARGAFGDSGEDDPASQERSAREKSAGAAAPDAITLLETDHANVKRLFEQVLGEGSGSIAAERKTIEKILDELTLHAKLEETYFYPAVQKKSKRDTEDRERVLEAVEEHASMKDVMRRIKRSTGRDETLRAKVQVLKEIVEHHVAEEEGELFPEARRLLGEKTLRTLGAEFAKIKARAAGAQSKRAGTNGKAAGAAAAKTKASGEKAPARRRTANA
jgi:hemerythrin superfamily protein